MEEIELKDFVRNIISKVEEAVDPSKRWIKGGVDIEVSIEKASKNSGGLKVYVFNGGISKEATTVSRVKFTVMPFMTSDQVSQAALYKNVLGSR